MKYFLEIDLPAQVTQRVELPTRAVRLGSASDCELKFEGLPAVLLRIEARGEGAFVRIAANQSSSVLTNGVASHEALVVWGADAFVDGVRLSFLAEPDGKRGTSPWLLLALGAAVSWLGWQGAESGTAQRQDGVDAIALVSSATTCPEADTERARGAAQKAESASAARQQRYPFDASEGLKAAGSLRLAEACFGTASDSVAVRRALERRQALEQRLANDQVALRLRLDSALAQRRWQEARTAIRRLDDLVTPLGATSYRAWLRSTARWIDARSSAR